MCACRDHVPGIREHMCKSPLFQVGLFKFSPNLLHVTLPFCLFVWWLGYTQQRPSECIPGSALKNSFYSIRGHYGMLGIEPKSFLGQLPARQHVTVSLHPLPSLSPVVVVVVCVWGWGCACASLCRASKMPWKEKNMMRMKSKMLLSALEGQSIFVLENTCWEETT